MGEHKLEHIRILKTNPVIKENIEELKFGCYVKYDFWGDGEIMYSKVIDMDDRNPKYTSIKLFYDRYNTKDIQTNLHKFEIIGQIHWGHLNMFLSKNNKEIVESETEGCDDYEVINKYFKDNYGEIIFYDSEGETMHNQDIFSDNTKSYMDQSEEFFEKLNKFLLTLK